MCHNFEPLAEVCAGVRTILAGEPDNIIESGVREKIILLRFSGLLRMSVRNPDNFGSLAEVSQSGQYRAAEIFFASGQFSIGLTQTS